MTPYTRPNYTTQAAATYKAFIDAGFATFERVAVAFLPHQQDVGSPQPDLSIRVEAGPVSSGGTLTDKAAQTVSGFSIPSAGQERVDRVVIDPSSGAAVRVAGNPVTGSPSAVPPAIPAGYRPCCRVRITSTDTVITNAMITDERDGLWSNEQHGIAVFTAGGTWTCPYGVSVAYVSGCGGGAGGAGGVSGSSTGGSGGAGAAVFRQQVAPVGGTGYTVTIGSGGAGGSSGNAGADGGTTSLGALVSLAGGSRGTNNGGGTSGSGGAAGGTGGNAGGGGAAGQPWCANGGSGIFGGGGTMSATTGIPGSGYGAGGSGGGSGSNSLGGSGSGGLIIVEW